MTLEMNRINQGDDGESGVTTWKEMKAMSRKR